MVLVLWLFVQILFNFNLGFCAPWSDHNKAWNLNFNPAHQPQEFYGSPPFESHVYFSSPKDWRSESIYQVITDRFSDGNPDNNAGSHFGFDGYDLRFVNTRHGGDFKGMKSKLPYIKSLGYSAVWISPVFQNMENSYHGYAQIDFTLLDDRFGTLEEFRNFVQSAHKIGLRVIVDIVVNHMADLFYFDGSHGTETPFHMHANEYPMYPHNPGRKYVDFQINNQYDATGKFGPLYDDRGQKVEDGGYSTGSFWFSDFHHNGDLRDEGYGNPWNNHLGKIYGLMDDLRTTHPRIIAKLTAMTKALITSTDIDGLRIDTPMQVPLSFFQSWVPAIKSHAKSLGKSNFAVFGEFYCTRERGATMIGRGITKKFDSNGNVFAREFIGNEKESTMDGGIHYPLYFWFMNTVKNQNHDLAGLLNLYQRDSQDYDFWNSVSNWQWQYRNLHFFNNHDQWRMSTALDGILKTKMSSAIIAFWPGIPLYYYGDEQGFNTPGTALDGWAREDIMTSLAWRHPKDECSGKPVNPSTGDSFNQTSEYFLHTQKIMNIRRAYWNLNSCDMVYERWHQENYHNGIYAFTRACGNVENDFVLVLFNTWKDPLPIPGSKMYGGWKEASEIWNVMGNYVKEGDKILPAEKYKVDSRGFVSEDIFMAGYEVKVFVRSSGFIDLDAAVVAIFPSHDQVLDISKLDENSVKIKMQFNQPMLVASLLNSTAINDVSIRLFDQSELFYSYNPELMELSLKIPKKYFHEGINIISVSEEAQSLSGRHLHGEFRSRIRIGDPATNILLNGCLNFKSQKMIKEAYWSTFPPVLVDMSSSGDNRDTPTPSPFSVKCMKKSGIIGHTGFIDPDYHYLESNPLKVTLVHHSPGAVKLRVRIGVVPPATSFGRLSHHSSSNVSMVVELNDRNLNTVKTSMAPLSDALSDEPILVTMEGPWTDWVEYTSVSQHLLVAQWKVADDFCNYRVGKIVDSKTVDSRFDVRLISVSVQYWADGSAAYITNSQYRLGKE